MSCTHQHPSQVEEETGRALLVCSRVRSETDTAGTAAAWGKRPQRWTENPEGVTLSAAAGRPSRGDPVPDGRLARWTTAGASRWPPGPSGGDPVRGVRQGIRKDREHLQDQGEDKASLWLQDRGGKRRKGEEGSPSAGRAGQLSRGVTLSRSVDLADLAGAPANCRQPGMAFDQTRAPPDLYHPPGSATMVRRGTWCHEDHWVRRWVGSRLDVSFDRHLESTVGQTVPLGMRLTSLSSVKRSNRPTVGLQPKAWAASCPRPNPPAKPGR